MIILSKASKKVILLFFNIPNLINPEPRRTWTANSVNYSNFTNYLFAWRAKFADKNSFPIGQKVIYFVPKEW